jgi:aryl-alcohol dehydrogenase-like predicted oxidoreductase
MQLRKLGRSPLEIFPLSLGTNVLGRTIDESTAFAVLDAYVEAGGNCIDTADIYSVGESELTLGRWMKARGNRDRVIIATKLGIRMAPGKQGLSRGYMFEEVEASLQRLQTEYIDLYQAHQDDTKTPLEETLQAFDELVCQGKVRVIGASNYSAARLAEALQVSQQHGYVRYESLQPLYNLVEREAFERELEPLCREHELGVITYSSLASGFLTGKYAPGKPLPQSRRAQGVQNRYMNERSFRILAEVERVASRFHATPAQVALAWIIARPGVTAPIASATSVEQIRELLGAVELQLDAEAITALNKASEWRNA